MEIEEFKYLIPEESREVMAEDVIKIREIESNLREIFNKHNIEEVLLPLFEYVDLYKSVYTNFDEGKVFKYIGKDGKVIALRWDFTIPIARHYFSHNMKGEVRYSYFGKVYRNEKKYKGRNSECYQVGIELVNNSGISGNVECINILEESLQKLKLPNVKLELGSAKFFNRLCELVGDKDKLTEILSKKNISEMEKFINTKNVLSTNLKELLLKLPRLCGDVNMLDDIIKTVDDEKIIKALKELRTTYDKIDNREDIIFDLSMCPAMEYYTCLMFKVYIPSSPEPIVSGGRYDTLYETFKSDVPAIGMAFYLDNILRAI